MHSSIVEFLFFRAGEQVQGAGPIEPDVPVTEIRQEPYSLPDGFTWDTLNIDNEAQLKELYQLLNENYVEDDDNMFRFDYSAEFLRWYFGLNFVEFDYSIEI